LTSSNGDGSNPATGTNKITGLCVSLNLSLGERTRSGPVGSRPRARFCRTVLLRFPPRPQPCDGGNSNQLANARSTRRDRRARLSAFGRRKRWRRSVLGKQGPSAVYSPRSVCGRPSAIRREICHRDTAFCGAPRRKSAAGQFGPEPVSANRRRLNLSSPQC
jgi:hypothetical protein